MAGTRQYLKSKLASFFHSRSSSSSSSDQDEDNLPAANGVDADEVKPDEPVLCPWEDYRCAFRILALWAKRMACQVAGDNHPKIEGVWLHVILKEAGYCRPFVTTEGNSEQPTPSYAPSAIPVIRRGFQDIIHGGLSLPYGPHITGVHTWGELAWGSASDEQPDIQVSEQRFEVYRNAVNVQGWQDHDVVFEGDHLQALLDARPLPQPGPPPLLLFMIRSAFPGWYHTVASVELVVEWEHNLN